MRRVCDFRAAASAAQAQGDLFRERTRLSSKSRQRGDSRESGTGTCPGTGAQRARGSGLRAACRAGGVSARKAG